ncbi:MAG: sigma-70 family RNA polymerase sigma factor [Anaerolineae bacterium]|nr:sigma-70 family RNA polymerase sigma factor [Anaerolineae bacterium]
MIESDDVLLEQARRRQEGAIGEIYDRYAHAIYRYLYRIVGDAWAAEDLTSEVFLKLLHTIGTTTGPCTTLSGWLYRVARNLAMDWFRAQAKVAPCELKEELVGDEECSIARVARRDRHTQLGEAVQKLTADQQQVILLRFGEGLAIKNVGRIMGKSEGAIKVLQYRAIRRLQKLLQVEGARSHVHKTGEPVRSVPAASGTGRNS